MLPQVTQQLNVALQGDHLDDVLCAFLQLALTVEAVILSSAQVLETSLPHVDRHAYTSTLGTLQDRDMLTLLTAAPPETTLTVRQLIQTNQSAQVAAWYRHQWNQPDFSTEVILASIANALRPILTLVLGNTVLLGRLIILSTEQLAAVQPIVNAIEILRASHIQIQDYLVGKGIAIRSC